MSQEKLNFFTINSLYQAIAVIEDDDIPVGVDHYDANVLAWQYLIDTGHAWTLQGWYGRTAKGLIEEGICTPKRRLAIPLKRPTKVSFTKPKSKKPSKKTVSKPKPKTKKKVR